MKYYLIVLFLFILFVLPGYSIEFDCHLSLDNYFVDKWDRTQFDAHPSLSTCSKVERNQYFWIYVFLNDYDLDHDGYAHVKYNITIKDERGNIIYYVPDISAVNRIMPKYIPMYLSEGGLKVSMEEKHPLGQYEISIEMKDIMSNKTKTKTEKILLVKHIEGDKYDNMEQMDQWMTYYYVKPKPQNIVNAIKYYCSLREKDKSRTLLMLTFFTLLLNDNGYLKNYLAEEYKTHNDSYTKDFILNLLSRSNVKMDDFIGALPADEQAKYNEYRNLKLLDPFDSVIDASQLDMLWATFMATGSYSPVLRLVEDLELARYRGCIDEYKNTPNWQSQLKAVQESIYKSLVWSLTSNARQHCLVKDYLVYIQNNAILSDEVKDELKNILFEL